MSNATANNIIETSYDSNKLLRGIGIPMEGSFYKEMGEIKRGDSIHIDDCNMLEVRKELESLFGKLSCHNSANDFDLTADALVYEIPDSAKAEVNSELLVASVVPEDEAQKRCFFEVMLNAPKDKDYAVLAFDWKEQRIEFYGIYRLCPVESCMQQKVVMKLTGDTYTIKEQKYSEKDIEARKLILLIQCGNTEAEARLVDLYNDYTASMIRLYKGKGLTDEEITSACESALIRAARKFDLDKDFAFVSYAIWWMKEGILQAQKAKRK